MADRIQFFADARGFYPFSDDPTNEPSYKFFPDLRFRIGTSCLNGRIRKPDLKSIIPV